MPTFIKGPDKNIGNDLTVLEIEKKTIHKLKYPFYVDLQFKHSFSNIKKFCKVRQGTLQKFLKIWIKNLKCAVSNKRIQDGRPGRYKNRRGSKIKAKQDGNVPSWRHILGSKIFKEQLLEKFGKIFFSKKNFWFFFRKKKYFLGRTMPKNSKRGHSGSFNVFYKPKTGRWTNMKDEQKL